MTMTLTISFEIEYVVELETPSSDIYIQYSEQVTVQVHQTILCE